MCGYVCVSETVSVCVNEWPFKAIKIRLVRPESLITQQALPPTQNGNWEGEREREREECVRIEVEIIGG